MLTFDHIAIPPGAPDHVNARVSMPGLSTAAAASSILNDMFLKSWADSAFALSSSWSMSSMLCAPHNDGIASAVDDHEDRVHHVIHVDEPCFVHGLCRQEVAVCHDDAHAVVELSTFHHVRQIVHAIEDRFVFSIRHGAGLGVELGHVRSP